MKDPIADMLIELKNAGLSKKDSVVFTFSKIKMSILETLLKAGFIKSLSKKGKKTIKYIEVFLDYHPLGSPKISKTIRVSKTSKRVYLGYKEIHPVRSGFGLMVLSTPKGIMTADDAQKQKIGGEVLFKIW